MLVGKILRQRYEIVEEIGSGAFGNTYTTLDRDFPGQPRRVLKHLCPIYNDPVSLSIAKRLFAAEAQCLSRLGEHNQIPRLFSYFEESEEFYLVQELVEGHDLKQEFQRGRKWSEPETVNLLTELLSILAFVHDNDIIHRDVKPANIMRRTDDGKLVLIDFGAVKEILTVDRNGKTDLSRTSAVGTPVYMPPEQAMGNPRKCSDIYAVGILGVQALTGLSSDKLFERLENVPQIWDDLNIEISPHLKSVLEQMVSFQYKKRFPDAAAALKALVPDEVNDEVRDRDTVILKPLYRRIILPILLGVIGLAGVGSATNAFLNQPDYTQLETYLQNQEWQKADLETDEILVKIAREKNSLSDASIKKLPCKALSKIDHLWAKNSDGRFGFSPQKQAYLKTGNKFDNHAEGTYNEFGNILGWRTTKFGGLWNVYKNLQFKNNGLVPIGHLPSPGKEADEMNLRADEREKLLSQFNGCGL